MSKDVLYTKKGHWNQKCRWCGQTYKGKDIVRHADQCRDYFQQEDRADRRWPNGKAVFEKMLEERR